MFSQDTKRLATGFLVCVVIVVSVALIGSVASADMPCTSSGDTHHLSNIQKNQKLIEKYREPHDSIVQAVTSGNTIDPKDVDGYNHFTLAKRWNESEASALGTNGCGVEWSTMTLTPFQSRP
jgi:hypothetical protein